MKTTSKIKESTKRLGTKELERIAAAGDGYFVAVPAGLGGSAQTGH